MIAIVDYGCGNLFSLSRSLEYLGIESKITGSAEEIAAADRVILPGVGAYSDAAAKLRTTGHGALLCELAAQNKPIMGICLGMQLLFEKSYEYGEHEGLGLLKGSVVPLEGAVDPALKVPHMGWNKISVLKDDPIFRYAGQDDYFYFVHSYYARDCEDCLLATAEYDIAVPAVVGSGKVYGTQFHPEKSGARGLALLKAFSEIE